MTKRTKPESDGVVIRGRFRLPTLQDPTPEIHPPGVDATGGSAAFRKRRTAKPEVVKAKKAAKLPPPPVKSVVRLRSRRDAPPIVISDAVALRARTPHRSATNPFVLPKFPPNAMPPAKDQMALDDSLSWGNNVWGSLTAATVGGYWEEGLVFPGYANLAGEAQRPEYRKFAEIIATEMTRKWIRITSTAEEEEGEDDEGQPQEEGGNPVEDKIKEITHELERLRAKDVFRKCIELDELFGRAHLYIDTGHTENRGELKTDIGDGRNVVSRSKVGQGGLKALRAVEPVWVYPIDYTAIDPLREDWYEPQTWFVLGKQVHHSRLLKFVGREVPDLLKPAYSFGGLSMTQMARPYVDNWLRTRQSVSDLIHAYSVFVLKTNLGTSLTDSGDQLFKRADLFNNLRDNRGLMLVDKETEDFANVSANIAGLHELQSQSQEQLCSVSGIPTVRFLGIQPTGLNNSDEGGIRMFYDWIASQQEKRMRAQLTTVIDFVQLSLYGEVDPTIVFTFEPLREMDEAQQADLRQKEAQTDLGYLESGVLSPHEIRTKVAGDPDSPYAGIDVDEMPDLKQEEEEGLDPKAGIKGSARGKLPNMQDMGGEEGEEGEEEDALPGALEDDEDEDDNLPYEERVKKRAAEHAARERPIHARADARQQAWKDGEGPFHERAAERSENSKDYLKMRMAARKSGLLEAAGLAEPHEDWLLTDEYLAQDDAEFESKHPRDAKGKFAPYNAGPNLKKALGETGFTKTFASSSGKFQYTDTKGNKIVVEPPTGGSKQSSKWTLYTKDGKKISGETGKNLSSQTSKLGGVSEPVKEAVAAVVTTPPPNYSPPYEYYKKYSALKKKYNVSWKSTYNPKLFEKKLKALKKKFNVPDDLSGSSAPAPPAASPAPATSSSQEKQLEQLKNITPKFVEKVKAISDFLSTLEQGKEIIKAAVQSEEGVMTDAIEKAMTPEQKKAVEDKYGSVANAKEKAQKYHEASKASAAYTGPGSSMTVPSTPSTPSTPAAPVPDLTGKSIQEMWDIAKQHATVSGFPNSEVVQKMEQEVDKVVKRMKDSQPTPTAAEKSAITTYSGGAYSSINKSLRAMKGNDIEANVSKNKTHQNIQDYLKTSKIDQDMTVYRKVDNDYADFIMSSVAFDGATFQDKGFASTSVAPNRWSGKLTMEVSLKQGQNGAAIAHMSHHPNEKEVLLPAGTKFRVIHWDPDKHHMKVEVLG